jgi:pimeloyl-ACP methyl ester carboxylesterase
MCHRAFGPARKLAERLAATFTVYIYDRRGRGQSGDTAPYAVQREVEDIAALIKEAGGSAYVFGQSSGAALALEAARHGLPITRLGLYEAPFIVDDTRDPVTEDYVRTLEAHLQAGRRGEAVKAFMRIVGVPGFMITVMRVMPPWKKLKAVAHTLPYDQALVGDKQVGRPLPAGRWDTVTIPTLVADGGKSEPWMRNAQRSLAAALPNSAYRTLEGQNHMVKATALAPVLIEFFNG